MADEADPTPAGSEPAQDDPTPPAAPPATDPPAPAVPGSQAQAPQAPAAAKPGNAPRIEGDFDPERAARLIERLRGESAAEKAARVEAEQKTQATLQAVAKALGLAEEDKPDPAALTAQLAEARAAERQRRTELQVLRLAPGLGADADALLDSQQFASAIRDLDPASSTFREAVEEAIRSAVEKSPRYRAASAAPAAELKTTPAAQPKPDPGKSGADMAGAGAKPRQITAAELQKMTPHQIVKAQADGLLDDLMGAG